jgi:hypothetical protein
MNVLILLLIFFVLAALTWTIAIALYQTYVGGPDLRQQPGFYGTSAAVVGCVTLASTVPFPGGYLISLGIWWLTTMYLELSYPRAVALFLFLAALSFVARLAVLGALVF